MVDSGRWLSVTEIAAHLGVGKDCVYDWIERKNMPAHRVGRLWRFRLAEVDEWVLAGKAAPVTSTQANMTNGR